MENKKTMKKYLILFCFFCSLSCVAQVTMSAKELSFRTGIENFLKEEGFLPSIDSDGDLQFKKEGELYWISIKNENPTYIEISKSGFSCDDAEKGLVLKACNYANMNTRSAKACLRNESVLLTIEMYCHTVDEFKYVFYSSLRTLTTIKDMVKDYYSKHDE